jgi:hypothetical protein
MKRNVLVRGKGVAASCCLQLLQEQAATADGGEGQSSRLPAILISQATQSLLADIFQTADLFQGIHRIRRRVVAWGNGEPVTLPHSAVVASEKMLLDRLAARQPADLCESSTGVKWSIITAKPPRELAPEMHFGTRRAHVREVELKPDAETYTCWVEAVEGGWLFLLSTGAGRASLISVGGGREELLERSRLVGKQVRGVNEGVAAKFAAYPRILSQVCGEGWLACGSAAMAFDPLCGEGAGNAAREAILACAAVRAVLEGESTAGVLAEYSLRLRLGFLKHLENCREFYSGAAAGEFWSSELALIEQGIAWTKNQLSAGPSPRFKLVNFELERIASAEKT